MAGLQGQMRVYSVDKQVHTLGDLIQGHRDAFARVVYEAIEVSLTDLGERVRDLDWANVAVAVQKDRTQAA